MTPADSTALSPAMQLIKALFAAINRNDMDAAGRAFAPDIVRTEPDSFPSAGIYRGSEAVKAHLAKGRGTWAEGTCAPEAYFEHGDKVVVHLKVHVRLHGATDWIDGRFADGFVMRNGQILEYQTFPTREEGMAWAGIYA